MSKHSSGGGGIMGFIYWIINIGYSFKFWGLGWGIFNIFIPVSLIWDAFKYLIKLIHPGIN